MFKIVAENTRKAVSTAAAVAIVSAAGLVMDQAHLAAAPQGIVEVGELAPVAATELASLPEVTVVAKREPMPMLASTTRLPEVVVIAKRLGGYAASSDRKPAPSIAAGF